ncbi:acyl-CoA dehydrogenase family protein [Candidatus Neomicrothrix parvicella]|uniref:acyl-CoA dehydrogenase family protein n=1 Tax=Candidatus Neomicrothrix TaxID=41949 RepID=UPI0004CE09DB|nr:acyl-CoA dehydrogenase family protein [Candidatus Microthrix sp.]MBK7021577.1 acyl-CoA dehydrogenase family protein [Candidatus Microthrix sp.]MBK7321725.1 acyl-CoA dehydrogenase family protein [Candidatus Microthrix sp.]MBL0204114.1 acyl-CoA dehydrogenase family protein [Candidatus Microthrix sp.]MBP6135517.1 acyl-CoA dehydrogenase family protein [Candidatus Microthrix sp.]
MTFTDEHELFRSTVRGFVETDINPHVDEWETAGTFPARELFTKMGALGLLGLEYDEVVGGGGADHLYTLILFEELGRSESMGIPMAIGVQTDMATPALAAFGSAELKQQYLVPAITGEAVAAIAVTEPDAGSDVAALTTRAVRDGDDWIISGAKLYITNGTQADWLCALVRTSDEGGSRGVSQIVIPTDVAGFSVARKLDKLGMRGSDTAELVFDEVRVPVANTIGEIGRGFPQQMQQFQNERLVASYQAVGAMEHALERTRDYLHQRQAFGAPLSANQYPQFTLAELTAEMEMVRSLNYRAAAAMIAGEDVTRLATIAKLTSARSLRRVADWCLQFHGGIGFMEETWTARFFRDARLWSIGGGADEVMLRQLARMDGYAPR